MSHASTAHSSSRSMTPIWYSTAAGAAFGGLYSFFAFRGEPMPIVLSTMPVLIVAAGTFMALMSLVYFFDE